jgi:isoleucyl-tRNA synthetase
MVREMERLRGVVEEGLAAREAARIKVRQPLRSAAILGEQFSAELEAILADELNVKKVEYGPTSGMHEAIVLDTEITPELRLEGLVRELSRKVNDLRKRAQLALDDRIALYIEAHGDLRNAVVAQREHLMNETLATSIEFGRQPCEAEWEGELGGVPCWVGVRR